MVTIIDKTVSPWVGTVREEEENLLGIIQDGLGFPERIIIEVKMLEEHIETTHE